MNFVLHMPNETIVGDHLALQINSMYEKESDIRLFIYSPFILASEMTT